MKKKICIIFVISLMFITYGITKNSDKKYIKLDNDVVVLKNENLNTKKTINKYDEDKSGQKNSEIVCNSLNMYIDKCKINETKEVKETKKEEIKQVLVDNSVKVYKTGKTSEVDSVYFNPVTGSKCDESQASSVPGVKEGCMKWYVIEDSDETKDSVTVMLDHNTSNRISYNSDGDKNVQKEIKTELDNLVSLSKWKITPRLVTATEIAKIVGADKEPTNFNALTTGPYDYFYFETLSKNSPAIYKGSYSWLYDYTKGCKRDKCQYEDQDTFGYWTSTPVAGNFNDIVWFVVCTGSISPTCVNDNVSAGVRPVITIQKNLLK